MADYTKTGNPVDSTRYISKLIRDEFTLIETAISTKQDKSGGTYTGTHDFTGAVINVPTATLGDSDSSAASTAFVANELALKANIASPTFTGISTFTGAVYAPTAAQGTSTTQIATTAFASALAIADKMKGTTLSSIEIGLGGITATVVETERAWIYGTKLKFTSTASSSDYMIGTVTSYVHPILGVEITSKNGSGTLSSWSIGMYFDSVDQIQVELESYLLFS